MFFTGVNNKILERILNECQLNEMYVTPYEIIYILNNELTDEDKQSHTVTECVKVLCESDYYEDGVHKTKSIDVTELMAQLLGIDCVFKMKDDHRDLYLPIVHKDNVKLKDACAEITKKINTIAKVNDLENSFKNGCTVLYRM